MNQAPRNPFLEYVESFLAFCELEKGLSQNTISSYQSDLDQFAVFAHEKRKKGGWDKIDESDISDWIYSLSDSGLANATLCRKLSSLRMIDIYLIREDGERKSFMDLVNGPRLHRRAPDTLTIKEVEKLIATPDETTSQGLRDQAMLELFYSSGLRVSELCGLNLQQVDTEQGALKVLGKGSKERVVPMGRKAAVALERYLELGRSEFVGSKTGSSVFLSKRGQAISRKTIWVLIKKYAALAGLEKPVKPHLLRHSFATHLLTGGADLRIIQELLGHADISTTQIYTSVEADRMRSAHDEYHPRSRNS